MSNSQGPRSSRLRGLYKLSVSGRIRALEQQGWLPEAVARDLQDGRQVLSTLAADKMVENVIGVFGLPLAIAPNFIVNGREYLVPLVVEEPSIVAALSNAAAMARETGGFHASCDESLLAGQIHITDVADINAAMSALDAARQSLLDLANDVHPRLRARGGGARSCHVRVLSLRDGNSSIVVHLMIDTSDAMGANLVNTVCEAVAPKVAEICGGNVLLRILSNLADRSVVSANVVYSTQDLATDTMSGEVVRDRIVQANDIALADPHRAATHNKGIMNGIDALAIATGNDWRAVEAGAHAFAVQEGAYAALTRWSVGNDGELCGEIRIPIKVGVVGGTLHLNPAAKLGLNIAGTESATELAELMGAVGLAQNFSALRALATQGIQKGHMRLHARSIVAATGRKDTVLDPNAAGAAGKIILLGEHAVVYGRHALALPIPDAFRATASEISGDTRVSVADWQLDITLGKTRSDGVDAAIRCILSELGVTDGHFSIRATSLIPRAMGLGSSAAFAVGVTRAVAACRGIDIDDERVNEIAFECEKLAHGTPSGIDNSIACYGRVMLFQRTHPTAGEILRIERLTLRETPPLIIAFGHRAGLTGEQVSGVRTRFDRCPSHYNAVFDHIDSLSVQGAEALQLEDYVQLGRLMNICQGLLNAIEVSTPELERMIALARQYGATGAKLTGAGGGGAIVALCPGKVAAVRSAFDAAGYSTLDLSDSIGHSN